jgi:hypothetical protein
VTVPPRSSEPPKSDSTRPTQPSKKESPKPQEKRPRDGDD